MYHPKLSESNLSMFIPGGQNQYIRDTLELLQSHWTDRKSETGAVAVNCCAGTWVEEYRPNYKQLTFILLFLLYRGCCVVSCGASCGIEKYREGAETTSLRQITDQQCRLSHNKGNIRYNCTDLMLKFSFEQGPLLSLCVNWDRKSVV